MINNPVWNSLAEEYDNKYQAITDWRLGYSVVENLLGKLAGKRILDYGCGSGKFSRRLRDFGALVTAVDISANAIDRAKQKDSMNIDYAVIENDDLSFLGTGSFDYAFASFVFCTMQYESQIFNISQQIYDKLKPEACFIVLEPHPESLGYEFISMKRIGPKNVRSGDPIQVQLAGMNTVFFDYWRSKVDYIKILDYAGFNNDIMIKEPIIEGYPDETFWKDERTNPPLLVMRAKKSCLL